MVPGLEARLGRWVREPLAQRIALYAPDPRSIHAMRGESRTCDYRNNQNLKRQYCTTPAHSVQLRKSQNKMKPRQRTKIDSPLTFALAAPYVVNVALFAIVSYVALIHASERATFEMRTSSMSPRKGAVELTVC